MVYECDHLLPAGSHREPPWAAQDRSLENYLSEFRSDASGRSGTSGRLYFSEISANRSGDFSKIHYIFGCGFPNTMSEEHFKEIHGLSGVDLGLDYVRRFSGQASR